MEAEDYAIVLDFMPKGKPNAFKQEPLVQLLGKGHFTLLEATPKPNINFQIGEEVFIGKEDRPKIQLIKGRIIYKDLTSNSLSELEEIVTKLVNEDKPKYLNFFNNARGITLKRHQIELLPGMGKKHMLAFVKEREQRPFASLEEIPLRVKGISDPLKAITKRVMEELEGLEVDHYLFVREPPRPRQEFHKHSYSRF